MAVEHDDALRQYTQIKQDLAAAIHDLRQFFHLHGNADGDERGQALLAKLAEDRFNLAVLGQFKRGKSSLMNAIIGRDLLPTGVLPLTSVVTSVCYGPLERLLITRRDWTLTQELPLAELADYVTERGNPGNEKGVLSAQVEVPVSFLRRGLYFIDTPGVGSANAANTATTYSFLPEADAVIFVTSVDAPLNEAKEAFLRDIRQHAQKIFFVINKIDLMNEADRSEVLGFVQARLEQLLGATGLHLYPVSARDALQAKSAGDAALLEGSGLPSLEAALAEFLSEEKSRVFLLSICDRALRLVAEAEAVFALELRAAALSDDERAERLAELQQRLNHIGTTLEETLTDLRAQLTAAADDRLSRQMTGLLQQHQSMLEAQLDALLDQAGSSTEVDTRAMLQELTGHIKAHQDQWLAHQLANLQPSLARLARPPLAKVAAALVQVPTVTAEAFGVSLPQAQADAEPLDWPGVQRVGVKQLSHDFIPSLLIDFLPWRYGRRVLRRQLAQALDGMVAAAGDNLRAAWRASIAAQVDEVARAARYRFNTARGELEQRAGVGRADSASDQLAADLQLLRRRFDALRAAVNSGQPLPSVELTETDRALLQTEVADHATAVRAASPVRAGPRACPICATLQDALFSFFAHWQYELSTKESARRAFAAAGGFCAVHTWQFQRIASPQGISLGYVPLIEALADQLNTLTDRSGPAAAAEVGALIQTSRHCPACQLLREVEQVEASKLLQQIAAPAGREAYQQSAGVCLPHLRVMLTGDGTADVSRFLIAEQVRRFGELAENMRGYTLKREATRRWLQNRDEQTAWWRALTQLIGERNVRALWPDEE